MVKRIIFFNIIRHTKSEFDMKLCILNLENYSLKPVYVYKPTFKISGCVCCECTLYKGYFAVKKLLSNVGFLSICVNLAICSCLITWLITDFSWFFWIISSANKPNTKRNKTVFYFVCFRLTSPNQSRIKIKKVLNIFSTLGW